MYESIELQNRKYEEAIRDIKADIYDVLTMELAEISELEKRLITTTSESQKASLQQQIKDQQRLLDDTMQTVNKLVRNIELLDSFNKEEVKNEKIAEGITQINEPDNTIQRAINKDLQETEISKEEIKDAIADVIQSNENISNFVEPNFEKTMAIIEEGPATTNEAEKIADLIEENKPSEEKTPDDFVSTVPELANIYNQEQAVENKSERIANEIEEVKNNPDLSVEEKLGKLKKLRKVQKTSKKVTKAIIVSKKQLERLAKSRIKQEELLTAKKLLKETDGFNNLDQVIDKQLQKEVLKEQGILNNNPAIQPKQYDDPKREIEDLMVKAKVLYDANQKEEAQELYNRISELSQTLPAKQQVKK